MASWMEKINYLCVNLCLGLSVAHCCPQFQQECVFPFADVMPKCLSLTCLELQAARLHLSFQDHSALILEFAKTRCTQQICLQVAETQELCISRLICDIIPFSCWNFRTSPTMEQLFAAPNVDHGPPFCLLSFSEQFG